MEKFNIELVITGGIQGTSRKQIYYELDLYSLVKTY